MAGERKGKRKSAPRSGLSAEIVKLADWLRWHPRDEASKWERALIRQRAYQMLLAEETTAEVIRL